MTTGYRDDPPPAFNFNVNLIEATDGLAAGVTSLTLGHAALSRPAGFMECTGLNGTLEVEEYMPGGHNGAVLKFPTRTRFDEPITLIRGIADDATLWKWFYGFVLGVGERKDGIISILDAMGHPHTVFAFRRGLPTKFMSANLNAMENGTAIETLEITHEGLEMLDGAAELTAAAGTLAGAVGAFFR